jgi:hypothetical protein
MARGLGWSADDLDADRPQRILAEWAAARGILFADVLPAFRQSLAAGGEPLFYTPDAHMTAEGHRQTALAVRSFLAEALRD